MLFPLNWHENNYTKGFSKHHGGELWKYFGACTWSTRHLTLQYLALHTKLWIFGEGEQSKNGTVKVFSSRWGSTKNLQLFDHLNHFEVFREHYVNSVSCKYSWQGYENTQPDACHEKTDLKVFVVVIPKEGWVRVAMPILLLVWHHFLRI